MEDSISVEGLDVLLDDAPDQPYLEITLRCNGRTFRAAMLAVEEEWALTVRDERGRNRATEDLWPTQASALLAALLTALDATRQMPLH